MFEPMTNRDMDLVAGPVRPYKDLVHSYCIAVGDYELEWCIYAQTLTA